MGNEQLLEVHFFAVFVVTVTTHYYKSSVRRLFWGLFRVREHRSRFPLNARLMIFVVVRTGGAHERFEDGKRDGGRRRRFHQAGEEALVKPGDALRLGDRANGGEKVSVRVRVDALTVGEASRETGDLESLFDDVERVNDEPGDGAGGETAREIILRKDAV